LFVAREDIHGGPNANTRVMRLPQDIVFTGTGMNQTTVLYGDPAKPGAR
jgi:hypothetical protein